MAPAQKAAYKESTLYSALDLVILSFLQCSLSQILRHMHSDVIAGYVYRVDVTSSRWLNLQPNDLLE
jgi:hypothetical protein